tara:strand:+ start:383 stop:562 length:180 start_codon:yes stop_codon:yes gene_type:complete
MTYQTNLTEEEKEDAFRYLLDTMQEQKFIINDLLDIVKILQNKVTEHDKQINLRKIFKK